MEKNDFKLDISKLKTISLLQRDSKIKIEDFAKKSEKADSFGDFFYSLPDILAAKELKEIVCEIKRAKKEKKLVIFMMGAHSIKCGLNPLIIDLMEKKFVNAVALNGAGSIHDFELAFCGKTSEDVETALADGSFGMSRETAEFLSRAIDKAAACDAGLGRMVGDMILKECLSYADLSLQANAAKLNIPLTIHIAIGTDIIHPHAGCNGANLGKVAMNDFHKFIQLVSQLQGGVVVNIGSAVIMPEVFLKAISTVRNLGFKVEHFTSVCFDMIKQYRALDNMVKRPTSSAGKGYYIIGHHEIMIPLLYRALIEGE